MVVSRTAKKLTAQKMHAATTVSYLHVGRVLFAIFDRILQLFS